MKNKITLRKQSVRDAKTFFWILSSPKFFLFNSKPKTVEQQRRGLQNHIRNMKKGLGNYYTILCNDIAIGSIYVKINQHRKYIGEVGFFIDENYWGQGIAPKAVKMVEKICKEELNISRMEMIIKPSNKASLRVAEKSGYKKEGLLKKYIKNPQGVWVDYYLFAKRI